MPRQVRTCGLGGLVGDGGFFLAPTRLRDSASMRVCVVNFRTTEADLDALLSEAARVGRALTSA